MKRKYILEMPSIVGTKQNILNKLAEEKNIELDNKSSRGQSHNYKQVGRGHFVIDGKTIFVTIDVKMEMIERPKSFGRFGTAPATYGNVKVVYVVQDKQPAERFY